MSLRPRKLPKIREQVLRHLGNPDDPLRSKTGTHNQDGLDALADHLRVAGLYWASADMAALAVSAGASLAAARWAIADRPSECGLIVWDGGVGHIDAQGVEIPVEACTWGSEPGGCVVGLWVSRERVVAEMTRTDIELIVEEVPPLIPIISFIFPVTAEPVSMAELPEGAPAPVIAALAASWLLIQQPNLADQTIERPDKAVRRAAIRAGRESSEVTVIDLRRQYVPQDRDPDDASQRRYRNRWVVSGHWRNQAVGPARSERRRTWVPSYVKGPDGAPLLVTERVNVWRR